ncbi:hypothetical protein [Rhodopirellula baltica]|uniref:Uncharacterized protein n=2 Tax=Rhodopirellula baltica TaxID=265606 RepID=F2APD3_RHOBT|nr:hypothetical protein [Rhodopirellula baltica]EGF28486.1 conserved hypothetical protein, secreted [Rhodopirellula baltica WH47]ELP34880.1 hypothetical protein RBSWK_01173 [Rhodopirellula baltica SWK14]
MNLSGLTSSVSTQALSAQSSSTQARRQGPPPPSEEQLASALQSVGVDDTTANKVLAQIDDAISELQSESSDGNQSQAFRSAVEEVLDANGIDSAEVEQALRSNGPSGRGRPQGPPPPKDDSSASSIESALLSAGVEEASADELVSQIIDSLEQLAADSDGNATSEEIRSALNSVLEENSVDTEAFAQSLAGDIDEGGFVIDRYV